MRTRAFAAAAILAALALAGCERPGLAEQDDEPAIDWDYTEQDSGTVADHNSERDDNTCDMIDTHRVVNGRLAQDGHAEDYSAEMDRLAEIANC